MQTIINTNDIKDLIIIGGGPAGVASGIYAARKKLSTVLVTDEIGGQSVVSEGIENWIGTIKISGTELAASLEKHLNAYKGDTVDVCKGECVTKMEHNDNIFQITLKSDRILRTRSVLVATGASRRKLDVIGAAQFENKGVTYCASCDGPLFSGQDVAVIGGGNAGFETAAQLLAYAKSVTLVHRRKEFRADPVTVAQLLKHPNMHTVTNVETIEVRGDKFVTGLIVKDRDTDHVTEISVTGIFVEIGVTPNTNFIKDILSQNETHHIQVDPRTQRASVEGVWAAGDCTDELYHQNSIAVGDAVKATEDLYHWIATRAKSKV